ncbi:chemoreceptor glutamine deamidase CheD [Alteromonas sp. KUL49]|uniref:chemoreceptor glutamine deamidase CheD n=1 Tax=Alteromonas sp. KUL49 TaxID=2480798 RepID=UPI00102F2815|nr:chemoreceptor glutamine deamidase CheD [Alteromonas sp. KUL49]TAP39172.1 chemoreceptor glutamine deamidase CheD [Alteromonas sp. KUL49]GEA11944.1 putative chemoreceptor glutamine deamidase CheD 1 [Alteromonas sp. KUL49]
MSQDEQPITYFDKRLQREAVKLLPGQYVATSSNKVLVTILGSCVSACIYDPETNIGGMNHFMLPDLNLASSLDNCLASKYGVHAMSMLIEQLVKLGANRGRLVAKAFGGGKVLPGFVQQDIGKINAEFVVAYLKQESIPLISSDLMSNYARKIYFFPEEGNVFMKRIKEFNNAGLYERESTHRVLLAQQAKAGTFTFTETLDADKSTGRR